MPIIMQKGQVMSLKVTSVVWNRKEYPKDGVMYHVHDIFLEDRQGNTDRKEYKTRGDQQNPFIIGVYQDIRCMYPNDKGDEIEPYDAYQHQASRMSEARSIVNASVAPPGIGQKKVQNQQQEEQNCYSISVGGQSIIFSMAWAKDVFCAEMAKKPEGYEVTSEDVERIIRMADSFNMAICDRINFGK